MKIKEKTLLQLKNYSDEQLKKGATNLTIIGIAVIVLASFIITPFLPTFAGVVIMVGIWMLYQASKYRAVIKVRMMQQAKKTVAEEAEKMTVEKETKTVEYTYHDFDVVIDNDVLYYEYDDNVCLFGDGFSKAVGNVGKPLTFVQEPENEHDNEAVAVFLNDKKLGYVYKGNIQKMLNDWLRRGDAYAAYINKIDTSAQKVTFQLGLYRPLENFEHKEFSLAKTGKRIDEFETRADNLLTVDVGECVDIEYNDDEDRYFVSCCLSEIGELPASANSFIEDNYCKKIVGIITENECDYNDKRTVKIDVYLIR